jgi:hypothetical protein
VVARGKGGGKGEGGWRKGGERSGMFAVMLYLWAFPKELS